MLPELYYQDLLDFNPINNNYLNLINIRGCNGSGKSTIPMSMINSDPLAFEITYKVDNKFKTLGIVLPSYNSVVIGHYHTKCGGMDTIKNTQGIKDAVEYVWKLNYHIIMEGIMASTVRQTYIDLFNHLNSTQKYKRNIIIYSLLTPLEVCLNRIQQRNGGKPIDEKAVENKWKIVNRNNIKFKESGFITISSDNSSIEFSNIVSCFLDEINSKVGSLSQMKFSFDSNKIKPAGIQNTELNPFEFYLEPKENIKHYPWFKDYKAPNSDLKIDSKYMDRFWYFMSERMNIYWKRIVLKQPAPWTSDQILQDYRFTNVVRDMDKLSIYVKQNILSKINEPCDDIEKRKKEILFNIMIFRLFVKIETWECIGFLYFDTFKEQWKIACEKLRQRKLSGAPIFTSAYFVFTLWTVSPTPDNHDKLENAINLIENYWYPEVENIYRYCKNHDMKNSIEYMTKLECVSYFTAYEWACDLAMVNRYFNTKIVKWGQDHYANVGPGAKKGLQYIFKNFGGMTHIQAIIYLRSIWKHEMQKRGTYELFVSQLPKELKGDIDLRVIEHCLCETSKYNKLEDHTGRARETFKPKTVDLDSLLV